MKKERFEFSIKNRVIESFATLASIAAFFVILFATLMPVTEVTSAPSTNYYLSWVIAIFYLAALIASPVGINSLLKRLSISKGVLELDQEYLKLKFRTKRFNLHYTDIEFVAFYENKDILDKHEDKALAYTEGTNTYRGDMVKGTAHLRGHDLITHTSRKQQLCIKIKNKRRLVTIKELFADEGIPSTLALYRKIGEWHEKAKTR